MPAGLAGLLVVFLAGGLVAARFLPHRGDEIPSLPDLSDAQLVEIRNASGRPVLSGEFRERTDALGNVEKDAALYDRRGRRVIGEIEIELPGPGNVTAVQELEVDIIGLERNAKHSVFVDDAEVAVFTTDDRGSIDIALYSGPPAVPVPK